MYNKTYYETHKEKIKEHRKKYYNKNKEKCLASSKEWVQENWERVYAKQREWQNNNKERFVNSICNSRRRRVEKLRSEGVTNPWAVVNYGKEPKYE